MATPLDQGLIRLDELQSNLIRVQSPAQFIAPYDGSVHVKLVFPVDCYFLTRSDRI
jgi:hypothetical protein